MYYASLLVFPTVTCCVCQHSIKALLTYLLIFRWQLFTYLHHHLLLMFRSLQFYIVFPAFPQGCLRRRRYIFQAHSLLFTPNTQPDKSFFFCSYWEKIPPNVKICRKVHKQILIVFIWQPHLNVFGLRGIWIVLFAERQQGKIVIMSGVSFNSNSGIQEHSVVSRCKVILFQKQSGFFGPPSIDSSVGSQSVTCLLELRLRCTVALYLVRPVYLSQTIIQGQGWFLGN